MSVVSINSSVSVRQLKEAFIPIDRKWPEISPEGIVVQIGEQFYNTKHFDFDVDQRGNIITYLHCTNSTTDQNYIFSANTMLKVVYSTNPILTPALTAYSTRREEPRSNDTCVIL